MDLIEERSATLGTVDRMIEDGVVTVRHKARVRALFDCLPTELFRRFLRVWTMEGEVLLTWRLPAAKLTVSTEDDGAWSVFLHRKSRLEYLDTVPDLTQVREVVSRLLQQEHAHIA